MDFSPPRQASFFFLFFFCHNHKIIWEKQIRFIHSKNTTDGTSWVMCFGFLSLVLETCRYRFIYLLGWSLWVMLHVQQVNYKDAYLSKITLYPDVHRERESEWNGGMGVAGLSLGKMSCSRLMFTLILHFIPPACSTPASENISSLIQ